MTNGEGQQTQQQAVSAVRAAMSDRGLSRMVWFGIRGEDAKPLLRFPEFEASFAIAAPLPSATVDDAQNVALEQISDVRVDIDEYDLDFDRSASATEFRQRLASAVAGPTVVVTYRPSEFVSSLAYSMSRFVTLGGMFKDRQRAFEHKPWVETHLPASIATLGWVYVADWERSRVARMLRQGPVVLRTSRDSGGVGIAVARTLDDVDRLWPDRPESFIGVSRYLEGATSVNLSGVVFIDGTVRLHPASEQLIGLDGCTNRQFGYCGNDFGAASHLPPDQLDQLDRVGREVGRWLFSERYVGAFGVDAMIHDGQVFFTEVNPRFQGSSALSAEIAEAAGLPDLYVDHTAACLGLPAADAGTTIARWAQIQPPLAHIVAHNTESHPVPALEAATFPRTRTLPEPRRVALLPRCRSLDPGAIARRLVYDSSVMEALGDLPATGRTTTA